MRDPRLWSQSVSTVSDELARNGLYVHGVEVSPVAGTKGNREFVVWCRTAESKDSVDGLIAGAVQQAVAEAGEE